MVYSGTEVEGHLAWVLGTELGQEQQALLTIATPLAPSPNNIHWKKYRHMAILNFARMYTYRIIYKEGVVKKNK